MESPPVPPARPSDKVLESAAQPAAKDLFAKADLPTIGKAVSIGYYPRGCLQGGVELPPDGPTWEVMRLSRNRNWGHPELVNFLKRFAPLAAKATGWKGILVGDMAQPRGGPLPFGHTSHQIGLDVDIWDTPMPAHTLSANERETMGAPSMLKPGTGNTRDVDPAKFTEGIRMLLYRAATLPGVARIFVAPGIKKAMCAIGWRDRSFLSKLRPWYGHDDHFHVRLECPPGATQCVPQAPVPPGDGCGADLAWWYTPAPYKPTKPSPPLTVADLPKACHAVLAGQ